MKVGQALRVNSATCPAKEWRGSRGGQAVCKRRSGKLETRQGRQALVAKCPLGHTPPCPCHCEAHYTICPACTNKHGMHYIKESQTSKAPRSCWKGMWHVKWNLVLMQTSGFRFLAAVTQALSRGLTEGLDRTPNSWAVTFRNTYAAQLLL